MSLRSSNNLKKGFTLIEMLVVVSVIGLLVSIAGYNNTRVLKKSKDAALMVELDLMRTAIYQYALQNSGKFPESLESLTPEYLNNVHKQWKGSLGGGIYSYDSRTGAIVLLTEGSENTTLVDMSGKKYADY
ncbi:MAG: type II secretion system protein [Candidatus Riflebacteria bacterium]|nr:type II secretion system protein [Candidatus Riflebacteria bacterium]